MIGTLIISILTCVFLIGFVLFKPTINIFKLKFESFYIITTLGALLILLLNLFPFDLLILKLQENSSVNPLKILILFLSVSFISISLDELGFFKYVANQSLKICNNSQYKLFFVLYFLISFLTIFTSNDIVILTFTPFICYFSKNAKINPIPYLVMEFITANTYSIMLSIGNPTNIYLSQAFNISFLDYFKIMALPTVFSGITSLILLLLIFKSSLKKKINKIEYQDIKIENKLLTTLNLIILFSCTILLAISNYINLEMWIICLSFFIVLSVILIIFSIKQKNKNIILIPYKRMPWNLIFFVLSMFTIVLALDYYDVTKNIYLFLNVFIKNDFTNGLIYGLFSTLFCNLINNIPMSILFSSVLSNTSSLISVYSTIIGSNIGAYLTPIGALAGIMWMSILKKQEINYSFKSFVLYGIIIVPCVLMVSIFTLIIIL